MKAPGLLKNSESRSSIPTFERYKSSNAWGLYCSVDIYNCGPECIRDENMIKLYVIQLCDLIEMKRFGDTQVVRFGNDPRSEGFSMVQLIETSIISGHFANLENSAYIDIFSCKYYDPEVIAHFSVSFFKGSDYILNVALRK